MADTHRITTLVGRFLLSLIFLLSGILKLAAFSGTVGFLQARGLPMPTILVAGAIACELGGALALLLGYRAKLAAWVLLLYLIPTTILFHNFWAFQGMERQDNMAHFLKNLAIMGGMLIVAANGAGPLSLDAKFGRAS